jgi:hypothetical protein
LRFIVDFHDRFVDQKGFRSVRAGRVDLANGAVDVGRAENLVVVNQFVLVDRSDDVAARDGLAFLEITGTESPADITGQAVHVHTLRDVDVARFFENVLQGTLDSIKDRVHDAGTEFDGERGLLAEDGISDRQSRRIFVDLNRGRVALELDDFSNELGMTNPDEFVHGGSAHAIGNDERSGDLEDKAVIGFFLFDVHGGNDDIFSSEVTATDRKKIRGGRKSPTRQRGHVFQS